MTHPRRSAHYVLSPKGTAIGGKEAGHVLGFQEREHRDYADESRPAPVRACGGARDAPLGTPVTGLCPHELVEPPGRPGARSPCTGRRNRWLLRIPSVGRAPEV